MATVQTRHGLVVLHTHEETKKGSSVRVVRIELSQAGKALLTSTSASIAETYGDVLVRRRAKEKTKRIVAHG